ncbi:MAG: hypothetical protein UT63_C0011G0019 [Candidatus Gottesmanbacteria bacterium GW2011_GWC2_39_8]|uniref:Oxidoreductase FAD/NAD(P)-binding domain-containing protein n=1 Tax=Candidatus Gottesmanbacteria bacterium GW2011_GWC2_39_8 TaxID=1618450 RepID=A0A0G0T7L3_9BACT|nr:MAG: hypothetical protein UT63_C0011G0019 [Candidatus Gottesmanbacteria bacterium GW2011_GWC2_39_8]
MLIYADRNPDSILFTEEISAFTKEKYLVKAVRVFSEYNPSGKFRNLINKEFISREITIPEENDFFICGSPNFVLNIRKILTEMGVNEENLQLELLTRKDRMLINKVITEKMNVITREKENFIIYQN